MTSESACIELIANSLFRNINLQKAQTRDLLVCPICRAGLEALQLQKDDKGNQTIWWVCKNTIEQKCSFPGEIPPEVFWVQRTKEECESGYIPPPNKEKLPRETWHLYPTIFPNLPVLPPHPETGESSLLVQEATFDTRDASLASDISSIDGRSSSSHDTSVIPIERNPSDAMVGGSNSYTTNESHASTVNQRENLVPTNTTATARKRPADGSFIQATPEKRHFLQQLHEQLKNGGLDEEELLKLSEKIKEMERKEEPLSESDLLHLGEFIRQDDYTDSIRQRIPDLSAADVTRIIKQKPTTEKFGILNGARLQGAKTATEFLKLLGLSGAPVTTGNKWRTETREQVDNVLRKAAKETKKSMDRMTQKRRIAEVTPNSLRAVIFPSSTKQPDAERQRQLEKECELKTKALIQSKLKQRQEAEKHALLAEKHRLEELQRLRLQQTIQEPSSELPVHTSYSEPFPSSTARDRHYSLQSYDGFNHDYPVPSADFDDLFDNLDSYEIDLR